MANFNPILKTSPGFGLLRVNPHSQEHGAAIRLALREGVRVFDLGSVSDEETGGKADWLISEISRQNLPQKTYEFLIRGALGERTQLFRFLSQHAPKSTSIKWTYLIEVGHGVTYEDIKNEVEGVSTLAVDIDIGISSSRFTYEKEDPEFLALEGINGIKAIEFPLNLFECAPFESQNQAFGDEMLTLLDAAQRLGLRTYTRRPFDAVTDTQLLRLISYPDHHRLDLDLAVEKTLTVALTAESNPELNLSSKWAHRLHSQLRYVTDPEQWKEISRRKILPDLNPLREQENKSEALSHYLDCMDALMTAITLWSEKRAAERNERIRNEIASSSDEMRGASRNLAEVALSVYRSMPGLTTVLIGMRTEPYVQSVMKVFKSERPLLSNEAISEALQATHSAVHLEIETEKSL